MVTAHKVMESRQNARLRELESDVGQIINRMGWPDLNDSTEDESLRGAVTTVSSSDSPYSVSTSTDYLLVQTSGGVVRVVLPLAADMGSGRRFMIKDSTGNATTNNITIAVSGTDTIDGASSFTVDVNFASVSVLSDGSNWFVF